MENQSKENIRLQCLRMAKEMSLASSEDDILALSEKLYKHVMPEKTALDILLEMNPVFKNNPCGITLDEDGVKCIARKHNKVRTFDEYKANQTRLYEELINSKQADFFVDIYNLRESSKVPFILRSQLDKVINNHREQVMAIIEAYDSAQDLSKFQNS